MFTLEFDKDFEAVILQAILEVERDFSLPTNSLINTLPEKEKKESLSVYLDENFLADFSDKLIRHSRELVFHKSCGTREDNNNPDGCSMLNH